MSTDSPASLRLSRLAAALDDVAATRARSAKTASLAALLAECPPADLPALIGLLVGRPRQGRIGIGFRGLLAARESASAQAESALTVADVDAALQRYAGLSGPGSAGARRVVLSELFSRADAAEQDLLVRSLGGEVRTGALEGVLTDAAAAAAGLPAAAVRRAVMLSGSLAGTVVLAMQDPEAIAAVGLQVGTAIQPMLASPGASVDDAVHALGLASVEHKLDGARIQVHRDGDRVSVYTRSLADVTARVPEIVDIALGLDCRQAVLDGETLMLDEDGAPRPFQETMSRFGADAAREQVLAPRFFDLLHLDGRDLLDEPLRVRRELLLRLASDHVIEGTVTDDPEIARTVLEQALALGHEGVLLKAIDSPYAAGRRGRSWLKVKPVHTYDLVVLAAEWGSGRRSGWLSNLHLGARDPRGQYGEPGGFVMVGKTFKGLTDELLRWQTETFPKYEQRRTRGAVFLRPEIVVEIAIDGVQASPRYPGGVALRFARVKRYRPDKTAEQADTIDALQRLLRG
ncbi:ATP-dependent DNA ligase [Blastococcus sp. Marseille-P5729]|uniref:ATP-dependent DNA ligase n=1 Tax=Blastococcus sp. Marseille-P5729 TaxID=2086582 RepID=UPI000D0F4DB5|nr:ATP-dependent DNA ligase [Blastococcus sp. Marseille-P5729]